MRHSPVASPAVTGQPPPDPLREPPGHLAQLVNTLRFHGFAECYRDERPGDFGSFMRVYERDPVRVRIIWDGRDRRWLAQLTSTTWPPSQFGEEWVTLPPQVPVPL